jgi:hypothetical protein
LHATKCCIAQEVRKMSDDPIEDPELNPLSRGSSWRSLNSGVQATLTCAGDAADGRREVCAIFWLPVRN